jgi:hypothetical protein
LSFNARTGKSVQGTGELIDALANNEIKLEDVDQKKLPNEFKKLSHPEIEKRIAKARDERAALQKDIEQISQKRADYIAAETKRLAAAGKSDSFDSQVAQTIRKEAARKDIHY